MFTVLPFAKWEKSQEMSDKLGEIFAIHIIEKGLIFLVYKDLLQTNKEKTNTQRESKKDMNKREYESL